MLIAKGNGDLVPLANTHIIGIRQVDRTIRSNFNEWMGIIHDRSSIIDARGVIMAQPQSVPHFMAGELPDPCQCHLQQFRRVVLSIPIIAH